MKKYENGEYIEMTDEELQNMENDIINAEPTLLERLEALEAAVLEEVLSGD